MKKKKVIYYKDELNDEFSKAKIIPRQIDESYKYLHNNIIWKITEYLLQNIFSIPIRIIYSKVKLKTKYIGKEKLKDYKNKGFFIYGNHTQEFADTFITSNAIYPKRNFFVVNPENVSMKGMYTLVQLLGAIPIPTSIKAMKNFKSAVYEKIKNGYAVTIFPEAHIWPYYTKIRPFKDVSFKYPVELNCPSFCMTNTYQLCGKDKYRLITYIDGPFWPNKDLNKNECKKDLRDRIYNCMVERSKNSNYEKIQYIKIK